MKNLFLNLKKTEIGFEAEIDDYLVTIVRNIHSKQWSLEIFQGRKVVYSLENTFKTKLSAFTTAIVWLNNAFGKSL